MFTGGTIWVLTHGHKSRESSPSCARKSGALLARLQGFVKSKFSPKEYGRMRVTLVGVAFFWGYPFEGLGSKANQRKSTNFFGALYFEKDPYRRSCRRWRRLDESSCSSAETTASLSRRTLLFAS